MKDWVQGFWMGVMSAIIGSIVSMVFMKPACAQVSWENNPLNYKNSSYNYDNSQYNYRNSQYNWENNSYNLESKSGIYNDQGNRVAYEVQNVQGTRNFYDFDGNRLGYQR